MCALEVEIGYSVIIFALLARYVRLLLDGDPIAIFFTGVYFIYILTLFGM